MGQSRKTVFVVLIPVFVLRITSRQPCFQILVFRQVEIPVQFHFGFQTGLVRITETFLTISRITVSHHAMPVVVRCFITNNRHFSEKRALVTLVLYIQLGILLVIFNPAGKRIGKPVCFVFRKNEMFVLIFAVSLIFRHIISGKQCILGISMRQFGRYIVIAFQIADGLFCIHCHITSGLILPGNKIHGGIVIDIFTCRNVIIFYFLYILGA